MGVGDETRKTILGSLGERLENDCCALFPQDPPGSAGVRLVSDCQH